MDKKDFLLSFLYANNNEPVDGTVKLMKELFLIQMKGNMPIVYNFEPYDLGPVSFQVYTDLKNLQKENLIIEDKKRNFSTFSLSQIGINFIKEKFEALDNNIREKIIEVKKEFNKKNNNDLILFVYRNYPKFTYRSKFKFEPRDDTRTFS